MSCPILIKAPSSSRRGGYSELVTVLGTALAVRSFRVRAHWTLCAIGCSAIGTVRDGIAARGARVRRPPPPAVTVAKQQK